MKSLRAFATLFAVCGILSVSSRAASIAPDNDGVHVDGASLGSFNLSYPVLITENPHAELKPVEKTIARPHANLKYANGAQLDITVADSGDITLTFKNVPATVRQFKTDTLIAYDFAHGGKFVIDGKDYTFPLEKPAKPHLYQNHAKNFQLVNVENRNLSITTPENTFMQVTDNREWNWKTFAWAAFVPLDPNAPVAKFHIAVGAAEGGVKAVVIVDQFGQDNALDFPGKVKSLDELKADVESEKAYYANFKNPVLDSYGGLPESGAKLGLQKTGFFHVEKKGAKWQLVDPDGNLFFHMGLCSFGSAEDFTYIKGRENSYAWLPPFDGEFHAAYHPEPFWSHDAFSFYLANLIRKYGSTDSEALAARLIARVRALGFNSGGAFSGIPKAAREAAKFPYVSSLPIGNWGENKVEMLPGIRETWDPFDEKTKAAIERAFAKSLPPNADDPLLIGYFLTNEPAHEDVVKVVPTLKGNHAAKRELVKNLEGEYKNIDAFNKAWGASAASFEQLNDMGLDVKTAVAKHDMKNYEFSFFTASHAFMRSKFQKFDKNHMLLGDRWQPQTARSEARCEIVGEYCDIVSVNYYTYGVDTEYLQNIEKWSGGKPIMLSEFHWCSPHDSGLPGGKDVALQQERGLAYRNYVEQSAALGFVVGIEWFTLLDQARTGRFFEKYGGENANTGIFSVTDRPWKGAVEEMAKTNSSIYDVLLGKREPFKYNNPRFQK